MHRRAQELELNSLRHSTFPASTTASILLAVRILVLCRAAKYLTPDKTILVFPACFAAGVPRSHSLGQQGVSENQLEKWHLWKFLFSFIKNDRATDTALCSALFPALNTDEMSGAAAATLQTGSQQHEDSC